ncbi:MAG: DUF2383 domain-containing protein [Bacteriovoracia bacterium]
MANKELIKKLNSLIQLDVDAIHAYDQAIDKIDIPSIRDKLSEFKTDHERHVTDLSRCVKDLDGKPIEFSRDFKGFVIEGMTALRGFLGTEGALKAMKTNENLTNSTYEKALSWDLPEDARSLIEQNFDDEKRHLKYIEDCLHRRDWEKGVA